MKQKRICVGWYDWLTKEWIVKENPFDEGLLDMAEVVQKRIMRDSITFDRMW